TSVHVSPPPEIVDVWPPVEGPSDATKATINSPAADVLNAGVVCVPRPSETTVLSTTRFVVEGPDETTRFTSLPGATTTPAAGFGEMREPLGPVALEALVTVPSTSPAPVIAVVAFACVEFTTFGTATGGGPDDTVRLTALPAITCKRAVGL